MKTEEVLKGSGELDVTGEQVPVTLNLLLRPTRKEANGQWKFRSAVSGKSWPTMAEHFRQGITTYMASRTKGKSI